MYRFGAIVAAFRFPMKQAEGVGKAKFSEHNSVKSPEHKSRRGDLSPCGFVIHHRRRHVGSTTVSRGVPFQPFAETTVSHDRTEEETPR